ncbi:sugar phosphate isomerase/epimerase family protein [Candidatus Poribacteria bacterium]
MMMPEIHLSVSPFGLNGLDRAVEVARAIGCTGLEVPVSFLSRIEGPEKLGGLSIRVAGISWEPGQPSDIVGALALAKGFHVQAVNIYGGLPDGVESSAAKDAFVKDVCAAINKTPDDSPILLLENELAKAPGLSASFDGWLGLIHAVDSPRFRGTLDAANFVSAGDEAAISRIADEALPLMGHAHVKGLVPFDADLHTREPFRRRWQAHGEWLAAPAGEGDPDWVRLLPELLTNGYTGVVTVEPFQEPEMILRAATFIRTVVRSIR